MQGGKGDLLVISDGSDHEHTPDAITEQLTGWSRPEQRLRQALKHNEFQIYFQPVIPLVLSMRRNPASRSCCGCRRKRKTTCHPERASRSPSSST